MICVNNVVEEARKVVTTVLAEVAAAVHVLEASKRTANTLCAACSPNPVRTRTGFEVVVASTVVGEKESTDGTKSGVLLMTGTNAPLVELSL